MVVVVSYYCTSWKVYTDKHKPSTEANLRDVIGRGSNRGHVWSTKIGRAVLRSSLVLLLSISA